MNHARDGYLLRVSHPAMEKKEAGAGWGEVGGSGGLVCVHRHCFRAGTTRSPSLSHCHSNNTMLQLLFTLPLPRCSLFTRPAPPSPLPPTLPAPTTHHPHSGHKEWQHTGVFFFLVVNVDY